MKKRLGISLAPLLFIVQHLIYSQPQAHDATMSMKPSSSAVNSILRLAEDSHQYWFDPASQDKGQSQDRSPYDEPPEAIKQVEPVYPGSAVARKLEGTVWIKMWVDEVGSVTKATIISSDDPVFDQPAKDAAFQWKFKPATLKGRPAGFWVSVPFRFSLTKSDERKRTENAQIRRTQAGIDADLPNSHHVRVWIKDSVIHAERTEARGELIWRIALGRIGADRLPAVNQEGNALVIRDSKGRFLLKDDVSESPVGASLRILRNQRTIGEKHQFRPEEYGLSWTGNAGTSDRNSSAVWKRNGWVYISSGISTGRTGVSVLARLCHEESTRGPGLSGGSSAGGFFWNQGSFQFIDDGEFLFVRRMSERTVEGKLEQVRQLKMGDILPITALRWYNTSRDITVKDLQGKTTVIYFWTMLSPDCVDQLAGLANLEKNLGSRGLNVLAIHMKAKQEWLEAFISKHAISIPVALDDGQTASTYRVMADGPSKYFTEGPPAYFVIDKKGRIRQALLSKAPEQSYLESLLIE